MNPLAAFWIGLPKWGQQLLIAIGLFLGFLIFGRIWLEAHDMNVRKKVTDKIRQRELEEEIALRKQAKETTDEIDHRVAGAEDAVRRQPRFESADSLRKLDPDLGRLILRDSEEH